MPLNVEDEATARLPDTLDLSPQSPPIAGVVISHPHRDHYGLAPLFGQDMSYLIGEDAHRVLHAAAAFTPGGIRFKNVVHLRHRHALVVGPFTITPHLVDHSAYDSYAIHVQVDGQGVLYTGDLRAHGRKAQTFEWLVENRPAPVDVLLMEGTAIRRTGSDRGFPTERELEMDLAKIFRTTAGLALVWCSGQNIDRLVSVFRAARRSSRQLIVDLYTAHILAATSNAKIPQAEWDGVRVYLPWAQKQRIKREQTFELATRYRSRRIFLEDLAAVAGDSVMLFRPGMRRELEKADCLAGACLVYSMWDGYLRQESALLDWLQQRGIPLHQCHTSGHAFLRDLKRLRAAFPEAAVVPIHTQHPDAFHASFGQVAEHADGEWWEVASALGRRGARP